MSYNPSRKSPACTHDVYIKGLCGNCGAKLDTPQSTCVSMIHSVPELKVSREYAKEIGKADQERLIDERKLVLLVDLDQTVLHTTHEEVQAETSVHSFSLWPGHPTYYTKLRPHLNEFLEAMSEIYELHIFTFGCRRYAHKIASIIDPDQKYFGNRILSRDESVDQLSKKGNLSNLFPCGDAMVCIIDDRADVWADAGNLIQVKPYSYFKTSISDGAHRFSAEELDESLNREVDELEALLTPDDEDSEEDAKESSEVSESLKNDEDSDSSIENIRKRTKTSDTEEDTTTSCDENQEQSVSNADTPNTSTQTENQTEVTEEQLPAPLEDPDEYLISVLMPVLSRIHEKWYRELDEQIQFLVDGESYKLPDIKDIIRRYLRKKF